MITTGRLWVFFPFASGGGCFLFSVRSSPLSMSLTSSSSSSSIALSSPSSSSRSRSESWSEINGVSRVKSRSPVLIETSVCDSGLVWMLTNCG